MASRRRSRAGTDTTKKAPDEQIGSWELLAQRIQKLTQEHQNWIIGGEPSTTYELRPAAGREGGKGARRETRYNADDERAALKRFKNDARPYVAYADYSDLEWLSIA